ncbi:hypothetical protein BG004_003278 [Podila humilis]|nr:hypothetical protein BG004_003278 [Podila humilis]
MTRHVFCTLLLLLFATSQLQLQSQLAQGSFLNIGQTKCGSGHAPCPQDKPCCNNGLCHETSKTACAIALGCSPTFSYTGTSKRQDIRPGTSDQGCFPLPACRSFHTQFKNKENKKAKFYNIFNKGQKNQARHDLVPKSAFTGDPEQALFTSDFDHFARHAEIDPHNHKLLLKAKRDKVRNRSGGGFGATVSTTRWSTFGTFSVKMRSGATGPGIVTAMMLANPERGEEISIELIGRDPQSVVTEFYRRTQKRGGRNTQSSSSSSHSGHDGSSSLVSEPFAWGRRHLRDLLWSFKDVAGTVEKAIPYSSTTPHSPTTSGSGDGHDNNRCGCDATAAGHQTDATDGVIITTNAAIEQTHTLKRSATSNALVYQIEWSKDKIIWRVDGQKIRTLKSKDVPGGLPESPMQLQLTIWDAGYSPETMNWAGAHTDYGEDNKREYATVVEWVDVKCASDKEGAKPWPGPVAMKRIEQVKQQQKQNRWTGGDHDHIDDDDIDDDDGVVVDEYDGDDDNYMKVKRKIRKAATADKESPLSRFVTKLVNVLLLWDFFLLVVVVLGLYATDPKRSVHDKKPHVKDEKEEESLMIKGKD